MATSTLKTCHDDLMMHGKKADLMKCLEPLELPIETPEVQVGIINGAALIHTLDPKSQIDLQDIC